MESLSPQSAAAAAATLAAATVRIGKHLNSDTLHLHTTPPEDPEHLTSLPTATAFAPANLLIAFKSSAKIQHRASAGCRPRAELHSSIVLLTSALIVKGISEGTAVLVRYL
jgi:hypothetical protein